MGKKNKTKKQEPEIVNKKTSLIDKLKFMQKSKKVQIKGISEQEQNKIISKKPISYSSSHNTFKKQNNLPSFFVNVQNFIVENRNSDHFMIKTNQNKKEQESQQIGKKGSNQQKVVYQTWQKPVQFEKGEDNNQISKVEEGEQQTHRYSFL